MLASNLRYFKGILYFVFVAFLDPYWLHASYFVAISMVGMVALRLSPTRSKRYFNRLDAFFTSVSAATVSSLGVVRMEEFSEFQLVFLTILMFVGGEVFTSMACLHLTRLHVRHASKKMHFTKDGDNSSMQECCVLQTRMDFDTIKLDSHDDVENRKEVGQDADLEYKALAYLGYISLVYIVVVQLSGVMLTLMYFWVSSSAEDVLSSRGINMPTFAMFTVVSSFANCGFVPLDDNMLPFRKHSFLLVIMAFQILLGNTMFASCFRAVICVLHSFTKEQGRRRIYEYVLKHGRRLYDHLFSATLSLWLLLTAVVFVGVQAVMLFALHWDSPAMEGLTTWEKLIGGVFQSVAIRHGGENVVNPQLLSASLIVVYVVMMYLPPYPIYLVDEELLNIKPPPKVVGDDIKSHVGGELCNLSQHEERIGVQIKKLLQHDACYLTMAVILICITERDKISHDPLNFKVVNIVLEVVSAYGNVGLSMGYSCELLNKVSKVSCEDVSYSLSGKWSTGGKIIIIFVMFLGRLKGIKRSPSLKNLIPHRFQLNIKAINVL